MGPLVPSVSSGCWGMGEEETTATDSDIGFPSNRLAEPVNGLNLISFVASSVSIETL